jgi:type I restriction enzyme, S subunit
MVYEGTSKLGAFFKSRKEKGTSGLPTFSVTLTNGLVPRDSLDRKMDTNLRDAEHLLARKGDIVYNMMRMWQGASGLAYLDCLLSPAYVVLAPKKEIDSLYASYLFKSPRLIYLFWAYSYGLTDDRLRLYYNDFKNIPVTIPTIQEQQRIAQILSTWDKAIEKLEALVAAKQKRKKVLMQQLLTGNKRFAGFDGEWTEFNLKELADKTGKNTFIDGDWIESPYITEEGVRLIQTGNIGIGEFKNKSKRYISDESFNELKCKEVFPCDLLICRLAEPAGRACLVPDLGESKMITSVDVTILRPDKKKASAYYLAQYFSLPNTLYQVESLCGGSTRSRVARSSLASLKIPLPPLDEQKKIASVLTAADTEIETHQKQLAALKEQKKGLIQQLLTGKKRVKVDGHV